MNNTLTRRDVATLSVASLASLAGLQSLPAVAQMKPPEEGTDYIKLEKAVPTEVPKGKIEVIEFFWYNCPHCNHFEPALEAWLKKLPKDVYFHRVHVAFRVDFVPQQHLFYTLEAMGKVDQLQLQIFNAIHREGLDLTKREGIIDWVAKHGIDKTKFTQIYDSFAIASKVTHATQLQELYKVSGVPALGIAGKFYTDGGLAQSMERALQITDYLVSAERKKQ